MSKDWAIRPYTPPLSFPDQERLVTAKQQFNVVLESNPDLSEFARNKPSREITNAAKELLAQSERKKPYLDNDYPYMEYRGDPPPGIDPEFWDLPDSPVPDLPTVGPGGPGAPPTITIFDIECNDTLCPGQWTTVTIYATQPMTSVEILFPNPGELIERVTSNWKKTRIFVPESSAGGQVNIRAWMKSAAGIIGESNTFIPVDVLKSRDCKSIFFRCELEGKFQTPGGPVTISKAFVWDFWRESVPIDIPISDGGPAVVFPCNPADLLYFESIMDRTVPSESWKTRDTSVLTVAHDASHNILCPDWLLSGGLPYHDAYCFSENVLVQGCIPIYSVWIPPPPDPPTPQPSIIRVRELLTTYLAYNYTKFVCTHFPPLFFSPPASDPPPYGTGIYNYGPPSAGPPIGGYEDYFEVNSAYSCDRTCPPDIDVCYPCTYDASWSGDLEYSHHGIIFETISVGESYSCDETNPACNGYNLTLPRIWSDSMQNQIAYHTGCTAPLAKHDSDQYYVYAVFNSIQYISNWNYGHPAPVPEQPDYSVDIVVGLTPYYDEMIPEFGSKKWLSSAYAGVDYDHAGANYGTTTGVDLITSTRKTVLENMLKSTLSLLPSGACSAEPCNLLELNINFQFYYGKY